MTPLTPGADAATMILAGRREAAYPLLALAITGAAYVHLLGAYFWADDFLYLYLLNDGRPLELLLTPHGGHVQPFRNLAYLLLHAAFGVWAPGYFAVVLATHLLSTWLLYQCVRRVTGSPGWGCFAALLWGTNPYNEGSLGWVAVYGHVLVGALTLWSMARVLRAADGAAVSRYEGIAWYVAVLLASLSFGTGLGIALCFPLVLALWLPGPRFRRLRLGFWTLPPLALALYAGMHWIYAVVFGQHDPTMDNVPRLLLSQSWAVPAMTAQLLSFGTAALAVGPFPLLRPRTPIFLAGLAALPVFGLAAWWAGGRERRVLAGALLLSIGAYGAIAAGRGPLFWMTARSFAYAVTWTRYHYAGTIGLALAAALVLQILARRVALPRPVAAGLFGAWLLLLVGGLLANPITTRYHVDVRAEVDKMNAEIAAAARAAPDPTRVFIFNGRFAGWGRNSPHFNAPGLVAAYIAFNDSDVVEGRRVYFVDPRGRLVEAARARPWTRTARMLVTVDEQRRLEAGESLHR